MSYDAFGTPIATEYRNAADTANRAPIHRRAVAACADCVSGGVYKVTEVQDGAPKVIAQHDLFGRVRRQQTQLLDETFARVDTIYDALGRVKAQTAPYRNGDSSQITSTFYDPAAR